MRSGTLRCSPCHKACLSALAVSGVAYFKRASHGGSGEGPRPVRAPCLDHQLRPRRGNAQRSCAVYPVYVGSGCVAICVAAST